MKIFDGLSRPMRSGGLALLGVAAIAVVLGCLSLLTDDNDPQEIASPPSSEASPSDGDGDGEGGDDQSPDGDSQQDSDEQGDSDGGGDSDGDGDAGGREDADGDGDPDGREPGDHDGAGGQDAENDADHDQKASDQDIPVRVYNNSTISDLGAEAGEEFRSRGWDITEVDNYAGGTIPTSTAYYRPDTDEEFAAQALARQFGMRAEPRFDGIADSGSGVIVIVTQDYSGPAPGK